MKQDESRHYYDTFSETYENARHHGYHQWLDERSVALVQELAQGGRTLEVGCGTGLILKEVANFAQEAVGLDLSHGMLSGAARRGLRVLEASATNIPFADNSFDLTYSFKVLAHVPDISKAVLEMARVTRPGGWLVMEFYNSQSLRHLIRRLRPAGVIGVGNDTDETDVFTRFDDLCTLRSIVPDSVRIERVEGLRVATLLPQVFAIPFLGSAWREFENQLSASPLRRFGGFIVLVGQKL
jgi:ubiquinone/menaquinone biosynthesis C-methylase UbiE